MIIRNCTLLLEIIAHLESMVRDERQKHPSLSRLSDEEIFKVIIDRLNHKKAS